MCLWLGDVRLFGFFFFTWSLLVHVRTRVIDGALCIHTHTRFIYVSRMRMHFRFLYLASDTDVRSKLSITVLFISPRHWRWRERGEEKKNIFGAWQLLLERCYCKHVPHRTASRTAIRKCKQKEYWLMDKTLSVRFLEVIISKTLIGSGQCGVVWRRAGAICSNELVWSDFR